MMIPLRGTKKASLVAAHCEAHFVFLGQTFAVRSHPGEVHCSLRVEFAVSGIDVDSQGKLV